MLSAILRTPTIIALLALSTQVSAHAIVAPPLGVTGTPQRSDVQRPNAQNVCGNINIAQTIDKSTAVPINGSEAHLTVTNFNGGQDGSRQMKAQLDVSGTGKNFVPATITQNGDGNPSGTGSQPLTLSIPSGTKCTGGASGDLCLAQFISTAGFGSCVALKQGQDDAAAGAGAAGNATTSSTGAPSITSVSGTHTNAEPSSTLRAQPQSTAIASTSVLASAIAPSIPAQESAAESASVFPGFAALSASLASASAASAPAQITASSPAAAQISSPASAAVSGTPDASVSSGGALTVPAGTVSANPRPAKTVGAAPTAPAAQGSGQGKGQGASQGQAKGEGQGEGQGQANGGKDGVTVDGPAITITAQETVTVTVGAAQATATAVGDASASAESSSDNDSKVARPMALRFARHIMFRD